MEIRPENPGAPQGKAPPFRAGATNPAAAIADPFHAAGRHALAG